jgi:hypothetical protein
MQKKLMYRVTLRAKNGLMWSVFIRAYSRDEAEDRALKRNPGTRIDRSPFPQS